MSILSRRRWPARAPARDSVAPLLQRGQPSPPWPTGRSRPSAAAGWRPVVRRTRRRSRGRWRSPGRPCRRTRPRRGHAESGTSSWLGLTSSSAGPRQTTDVQSVRRAARFTEQVGPLSSPPHARTPRWRRRRRTVGHSSDPARRWTGTPSHRGSTTSSMLRLGSPRPDGSPHAVKESMKRCSRLRRESARRPAATAPATTGSLREAHRAPRRSSGHRSPRRNRPTRSPSRLSPLCGGTAQAEHVRFPRGWLAGGRCREMSGDDDADAVGQHVGGGGLGLGAVQAWARAVWTSWAGGRWWRTSRRPWWSITSPNRNGAFAPRGGGRGWLMLAFCLASWIVVAWQ